MKKNKLLVILGVAAVAFFLFKDQITAMLGSSSTYKVATPASSAGALTSSLGSIAGAIGAIFKPAAASSSAPISTDGIVFSSAGGSDPYAVGTTASGGTWDPATFKPDTSTVATGVPASSADNNDPSAMLGFDPFSPID